MPSPVQFERVRSDCCNLLQAHDDTANVCMYIVMCLLQRVARRMQAY